MIIGETLVNYLSDGGADITIINENLLNKIKALNQSDEITKKTMVKQFNHVPENLKFLEQSQYRN